MAGEWPVVRLGDVADFVTGFPFESQQYTNDPTAPRLLRGDNVGQGILRWDGAKRWPATGTGDLGGYWLREGDVILAMDRPWIEAGLKYAAVRDSDLPALLVQRVARLRGTAQLHTGFLKYVIGGRAFTDYITGIQTGTAVPHISGGQIRSYEFPLPPLPQQRAIAHILGTMDDKIELDRRMSETLESIARALFKSWFVDFDPVRANAEGRDPGLPPHLADVFPARLVESELGEIPDGWQVAPLSDCVDVLRGLSYKGSGLSNDGVPMHNLDSIYEGGGYKLDGLKHYEGEYKPQHVARAGDLIVANTEQGHHRLLIGYAAIVPTGFEGQSLFSHHIYRVRTKSSSGLTPDYLCYLLNSGAMHDTVSGYANGTTVNMLPMDGLRTPRVMVPPARVVTAFNKIAEMARRQHEGMVEQARTLAALRNALLSKLISGELRVEGAGRLATGVGE
jgi:type I restriction enzyme, S subunit